MTRRSNTWRRTARNAAYEYPKLRAELRDLQSQSITPSLSGMPSGAGEHRSTEDAALRQLPAAEQRRHDAVAQAVQICGQLTSGPSRVKLIELVYFRRSHTVEGAALQIPISSRQAWGWNNDFLLLVWARLRDQ